MTKLATEYIADEITTTKPTSIETLIDPKTTSSIRNLLETGLKNAIPAVLSNSQLIRDTYLDVKEKFFLVLFGIAKNDTSPLTKYLKSTKQAKEDSICFAKSDMAWDNYWELELFVGSDTRNDPAHETIFKIKEGENLYAFEAMIRFLAYLRAEITAKRIAKIENDFDDIQYAICAAISGYLATKDSRLTEMATGCMPSIYCFSSRYPPKAAG